MSHLRLVYSGEPEVVDPMTWYCRELTRLRERQDRERAEEAAQAEQALVEARRNDWRGGRGPNPDECVAEDFNFAFSLWAGWSDPAWRALTHAERLVRINATSKPLSGAPPQAERL